MSSQLNAVLSEKEVDILINGGTISREIDDGVVNIRQSYGKDIAAPIIDREITVVSKQKIADMRSVLNDINCSNINKIGY